MLTFMSVVAVGYVVGVIWWFALDMLDVAILGHKASKADDNLVAESYRDEVRQLLKSSPGSLLRAATWPMHTAGSILAAAWSVFKSVWTVSPKQVIDKIRQSLFLMIFWDSTKMIVQFTWIPIAAVVTAYLSTRLFDNDNVALVTGLFVVTALHLGRELVKQLRK